jgi:antitoxin (DNA-binding transcriptional repressor) of toxin-antitoxin stability system
MFVDKVATGGYFMAMRKVGIKALKNGLSGYIRAVAAGETLLVTDRDRVVAEIRPPRPASEGTEAERGWAELVRLGVVTPARIPPEAPMPPRRTPIMSIEEMLRDLDEARGDD